MSSSFCTPSWVKEDERELRGAAGELLSNMYFGESGKAPAVKRGQKGKQGGVSAWSASMQSAALDAVTEMESKRPSSAAVEVARVIEEDRRAARALPKPQQPLAEAQPQTRREGRTSVSPLHAFTVATTTTLPALPSPRRSPSRPAFRPTATTPKSLDHVQYVQEMIGGKLAEPESRGQGLRVAMGTIARLRMPKEAEQVQEFDLNATRGKKGSLATSIRMSRMGAHASRQQEQEKEAEALEDISQFTPRMASQRRVKPAARPAVKKEAVDVRHHQRERQRRQSMAREEEKERRRQRVDRKRRRSPSPDSQREGESPLKRRKVSPIYLSSDDETEDGYGEAQDSDEEEMPATGATLPGTPYSGRYSGFSTPDLPCKESQDRLMALKRLERVPSPKRQRRERRRESATAEMEGRRHRRHDSSEDERQAYYEALKEVTRLEVQYRYEEKKLKKRKGRIIAMRQRVDDMKRRLHRKL